MTSRLKVDRPLKNPAWPSPRLHYSTMRSVIIVAVVLLFVADETSASNATTKQAECPKGFKLYERTPTARNKFTKQWCLKVRMAPCIARLKGFQVVENEDVYDRPTARSVCMDYDAVITTVENQNELDDVNGKRLLRSRGRGRIPRCWEHLQVKKGFRKGVRLAVLSWWGPRREGSFESANCCFEKKSLFP